MSMTPSSPRIVSASARRSAASGPCHGRSGEAQCAFEQGRARGIRASIASSTARPRSPATSASARTGAARGCGPLRGGRQEARGDSEPVARRSIVAAIELRLDEADGDVAAANPGPRVAEAGRGGGELCCAATAAIAGAQVGAGQVARRERDEERVAGGVEDVARLLEHTERLVDPALVDEDLGDVGRLDGRARRCRRPASAASSRLRVQPRGGRPVAAVVGADADQAEHLRRRQLVADLVVEGERLLQVDHRRRRPRARSPRCRGSGRRRRAPACRRRWRRAIEEPDRLERSAPGVGPARLPEAHAGVGDRDGSEDAAPRLARGHRCAAGLLEGARMASSGAPAHERVRPLAVDARPGRGVPISLRAVSKASSPSFARPLATRPGRATPTGRAAGRAAGGGARPRRRRRGRPARRPRARGRLGGLGRAHRRLLGVRPVARRPRSARSSIASTRARRELGLGDEDRGHRPVQLAPRLVVELLVGDVVEELVAEAHRVLEQLEEPGDPLRLRQLDAGRRSARRGRAARPSRARPHGGRRPVPTRSARRCARR